MMSFICAYGIGLAITLGIMTILWLVSLSIKNSSIVDIFWGTGFVIVNWIYFVLTPEGFLMRKLLIGVLVTIWGLRLSIYILYRNWGKPEDFRYQKWRREAGNKWWWQSFFRVFFLQGILLWIISIPLLTVQRGVLPASLTIFDFLGVAIWLVGFYFESMGDFQLTKFKFNPENKGRVMDSGVWYYTRHPNYFGDASQWWGYYIIAAFSGGWWTILSPILMTLLLLRVSGVALLEKTMETRPGYKEYINRTSAFIPWFPKKK
jgi:steroid 5-alpha reductase family enzyme